jgi:hypothetical protein
MHSNMLLNPWTSTTHMRMPVPDHFSPVNEPPSPLLPVDNDKGEVIKNRPAIEPELFMNSPG